MHWLLNLFGITNTGGRWYAFWGGIFSDIPLFLIFYGLARRHNCHVKGCWRIGLRKVEGTEHTVCRTHHPAEKGPHVSAEDIARQARDAQAAGYS